MRQDRLEAQLQRTRKLEALGKLAGGVAHDFNNLLTVILGNITFVERDLEAADLDGRLRQRLATMRTAADRGATLTSQLLAFSRRQRLEPKPVDLNETVASMRSLLQSTMGGSVRIETVLKPDLWPALVDPTQIELIILNLAINARDAMEVGGSLTVETRNVQLREPFDQAESPSPGEYVMMSVSDTGVGMSEEVLAKAFEPFFTTKDVGKGSGLGLAQVYGFARQSGGGVRIRTQVGEGTSVEVYLPRAAAQDSPARRSASDVVEMHAPLLTRRILLVDDDSAVRDVTASMLADVGYRVVTAGSGAAALDLLERSDDFDLLLVDYAMPGMSGAETAAEARRRRPELPVLFITGFADLAALKDVGDERIVQKPFRDGELATKVRCALGGHQNGPRRAAVITLDRHRG
jgi:CheY-like chemotaxis protein